MKQFKERTINGINIPNETLEKARLNDAISAKILEDVIIIRNHEMTTMNILNTIETLQEEIIELYDILEEKFAEEDIACPFCNHVVTDVIDYLNYGDGLFCVENFKETIEEIGSIEDAIAFVVGIFGPNHEDIDFFTDNDDDSVTFEVPDYRYDLSYLSEEMLDILQDNGICLGKINQSLMKGDVVYVD